MNRYFALATFLTLAACGGSEALDADVDAAAEAAVVAESVAALSATSEVGGPIVDRDETPADVMEGVRSAYGRRMTCADISLAAGVLEVDFGTGCPVNGHTVAGALSVAPTRTSSGATFTLTLDELTVDTVSTDGSVVLSHQSGTLGADATLLVTQGADVSEHLFSGTMTPDATGVALDGTASRDDGASQRDLTFAGIYSVYGECYPNAGTVTVELSGQPTTVVTFDAQTPATGEVRVQVGRLPAQTVTLPACPR